RYLDWQEWVWPAQPGGWAAAMERDEFLRLQVVLDSRKYGRGRAAADTGWARDVLRFRDYPEREPVLGLYAARSTRYLTYELRRSNGSKLVYVDRELVHEHATAALRAVLCDPGLVAVVTRRCRQQAREKTVIR